MQRWQHLDGWVTPASSPWVPPSPDPLQSPYGVPREFPPACQVPGGHPLPLPGAASCGAGLGPGEAQRRPVPQPRPLPGAAAAPGSSEAPKRLCPGFPCPVSGSAAGHTHPLALPQRRTRAGRRAANALREPRTSHTPRTARIADRGATRSPRAPACVPRPSRRPRGGAAGRGAGRGPTPQRRGQARCAHLSSRKLVAPLWKKPTAMQTSLVTAWSNAWGQKCPQNARVRHPITLCHGRSP